MAEKLNKVPFRAPLHKLDTESQTFGCRANNPDICANNSLPRVCVFSFDDGIAEDRLGHGRSSIYY